MKSLVLASETTKRAYQELMNTSNQNLISQDPTTESESRTPKASTLLQSTTNGRQLNMTRQKDPVLPSQARYRPIVSQTTENLVSVPNQPILTSISSTSSKISTKYTDMWTLVDRLELALRNLETAKWKHCRIKRSLEDPLLETPQGKANKAPILLLQLEQSLFHFGLNENDIHQAIASLKIDMAGVGMRLEVKHAMAKQDSLFGKLASIGVPWESRDVSVCSYPHLLLCKFHLIVTGKSRFA